MATRDRLHMDKVLTTVIGRLSPGYACPSPGHGIYTESWLQVMGLSLDYR